MKNHLNQFVNFRNLVVVFLLVLVVAPFCSRGQVVGLDNWYNREVKALTGKPFHYL